MIVWVLDGKVSVIIHSIHDIPAAVHCIRVTNTVCCHNVVQGPTSKPTNCTGKPDIW
jgi:hypothetical protein